MQLQDAAAIVTGGASGLGLATAARLVEAGARVTILDRGDGPGAEAARGLGARFAAADVTEADQVADAIGRAKQDGPVRILVHCAGRGSDRLRIVDRDHNVADLDSFAEVVRINLVGTYNVLRLVAAEMSRNAPAGDCRGAGLGRAARGPRGRGPLHPMRRLRRLHRRLGRPVPQRAPLLHHLAVHRSRPVGRKRPVHGPAARLTGDEDPRRGQRRGRHAVQPAGQRDPLGGHGRGGPARVLAATGRHGADVVIDTVPGATVPTTDGLACLAQRGRLIVAGIKGRRLDGLDIDALTLREYQIRGVFGSSRFGTRRAPQMLATPSRTCTPTASASNTSKRP